MPSLLIHLPTLLFYLENVGRSIFYTSPFRLMVFIPIQLMRRLSIKIKVFAKGLDQLYSHKYPQSPESQSLSNHLPGSPVLSHLLFGAQRSFIMWFQDIPSRGQFLVLCHPKGTLQAYLALGSIFPEVLKSLEISPSS